MSTLNFRITEWFIKSNSYAIAIFSKPESRKNRQFDIFHLETV